MKFFRCFNNKLGPPRTLRWRENAANIMLHSRTNQVVAAVDPEGLCLYFQAGVWCLRPRWFLLVVCTFFRVFFPPLSLRLNDQNNCWCRGAATQSDRTWKGHITSERADQYAQTHTHTHTCRWKKTWISVIHRWVHRVCLPRLENKTKKRIYLKDKKQNEIHTAKLLNHTK